MLAGSHASSLNASASPWVRKGRNGGGKSVVAGRRIGLMQHADWCAAVYALVGLGIPSSAIRRAMTFYKTLRSCREFLSYHPGSAVLSMRPGACHQNSASRESILTRRSLLRAILLAIFECKEAFMVWFMSGCSCTATF